LSKISSDFDLLLDEYDIDAILQDPYTDFDENVCRIVNDAAQGFVNDLFSTLRERMIDLRTAKTIFVGGGSALLKRQIFASGKVKTPLFVDEITANAQGYDLLYRAQKLRR
jgi:plasmid segregation protein ParM